MICWKRTLRTASSERFLAQREGKDVAAFDLHCLASGSALTSERFLLSYLPLAPRSTRRQRPRAGLFF